jgi:hypothetical protein
MRCGIYLDHTNFICWTDLHSSIEFACGGNDITWTPFSSGMSATDYSLDCNEGLGCERGVSCTWPNLALHCECTPLSTYSCCHW